MHSAIDSSYLELDVVNDIRASIVAYLKAHGGTSTRTELEHQFDDRLEFHVAIEGLDDFHVLMFDPRGERVFLFSGQVQ